MRFELKEKNAIFILWKIVEAESVLWLRQRHPPRVWSIDQRARVSGSVGKPGAVEGTFVLNIIEAQH